MNDKTKASITPAPEETKNIKTEAQSIIEG